MNRAGWVGLLIGLALIAGAFWWLYFRDAGDGPAPEPVAQTPEATAEEPREQPPEGPRFPLVEPPGEDGAPDEPLPALAESDEALRDDMAGLPQGSDLDEQLVGERVIERLVATINALDAPAVPLKLWPVRPLPSRPEVDVLGGGRYRWDRANYRRYAPYVRLFTEPEAEALATLYLRYYPLMQEAYDALGETRTQYFNDRLIAIIDHLLATPEVPERPVLVQPKVLYHYADPALQSLSAGQKILVRMGPEHAAAIKEQLRALRAAIVARTQPPEEDMPEGDAPDAQTPDAQTPDVQAPDAQAQNT